MIGAPGWRYLFWLLWLERSGRLLLLLRRMRYVAGRQDSGPDARADKAATTAAACLLSSGYAADGPWWVRGVADRRVSMQRLPGRARRVQGAGRSRVRDVPPPAGVLRRGCGRRG